MDKIMDGFKGEKAIVTPYNIRKLQSENPITKLLYITHIGYYPHAKYHYRERLEGCDENIFAYCGDGKGWIQMNGEKHILTKNSAFIIPATVPHIYGADNTDPWSVYWFHFRGQNTELFSSIIGRLICIGESDSSRHDDRLLIFEEMYQNLDMGYDINNLEYVSFCLTYFLASLKYISQYHEIKKVKEKDVIQKSIYYMKDNLENSISLSEISKYVGYSSSYFSNIFTRKTSYSPMDYYNRLKIQRACSYLQFSDMKIKEIAFRLGYFDPFHFSKAFKLEMEITPKEYRRRYSTKALPPDK